MIHIQGDGGHAKVVREILRTRYQYQGNEAIIAVGNNAARKREALRLESNYYFITAVHRKAWIAGDVKIGVGTVVCAGAMIQPGARIGRHCIVNTGATVDHDAVLEDFVHIAPGAHLCGGVHVGEGAFIGVGVGIEPGVQIPAWSVVKRARYDIALPDHA